MAFNTIAVLYDGRTIQGYCNRKNYNGYYYLTREGFKKPTMIPVTLVKDMQRIEQIRR